MTLRVLRLARGENVDDLEPERAEIGDGEDANVSEKKVPTDVPMPDGMEMRVFRMVLPMTAKKASETIKGTMEMLMRLRADGFEVHRAHTDRGKEFRGRFQSWGMNRGLVVTRTAGDDPRANGRAEVAVQYVKCMLRKALDEARAEVEFWPLAARHINEVLRCKRRGDDITFPPFVTKVLVRQRGWKRDELSPTMHEVSYVCPSWSDHGHWVLKSDDVVAISRYTIKPAKLMRLRRCGWHWRVVMTETHLKLVDGSGAREPSKSSRASTGRRGSRILRRRR